MSSENNIKQENKEIQAGIPVQLIILIVVITLGVLTMALKAAGLF